MNTNTTFIRWLYACMHYNVGDHTLKEMAADPPIPIPDEATQLSWFDNQDWDAVRGYHGRWYQSASLRLIKEAPEDVVTFYVYYCAPLDEQRQIALAQRDIDDKSHLAGEYFRYYYACPEAQKLIKGYDAQLWHRVLMVNYGWEWEFEQKHGSLAIWQQKLRAHFDELTSCSFEEIPELLASIA